MIDDSTLQGKGDLLNQSIHTDKEKSKNSSNQARNQSAMGNFTRGPSKNLNESAYQKKGFTYKYSCPKNYKQTDHIDILSMPKLSY